MAHRRVPRDAPASTLFSSWARTAMRNARASQGRRASCAGDQSNAVCGIAAIDSIAGVLIARSPSSTNRRGFAALGRPRLSLAQTGAARERELVARRARQQPPRPPRLEIGRYLTKVREWTRASSGKFAASTAWSPNASARSRPIICAEAGRWRRRGSFSKSAPTASMSARCASRLGLDSGYLSRLVQSLKAQGLIDGCEGRRGRPPAPGEPDAQGKRGARRLRPALGPARGVDAGGPRRSRARPPGDGDGRGRAADPGRLGRSRGGSARQRRRAPVPRCVLQRARGALRGRVRRCQGRFRPRRRDGAAIGPVRASPGSTAMRSDAAGSSVPARRRERSSGSGPRPPPAAWASPAGCSERSKQRRATWA